MSPGIASITCGRIALLLWTDNTKARGEKKTFVMEAMCDSFLYICYFNFGATGFLNDINVLDRSSIVGALIPGTFDNKVPP